jgi:VanZ family protein
MGKLGVGDFHCSWGIFLTGTFNNGKRACNWVLAGVLAAIIVGMLYFGLRPKGYSYNPVNNVKWAQEGPGLAFGRYAVAYTGLQDFSALTQNGFSVVFAVHPQIPSRPDYRILMMVHDGDDLRQLVVGQWRTWIVAMNGDDYNARGNVRRLSVHLPDSEDAVWVAFTSGESGTSVYLNGQLSKTDPLLNLRWPNEGAQARLVVGNSIYGRHSWHGELTGLAVFEEALDAKSVSWLFDQWRQTGKFAHWPQDGLKMLFPLVEGKGDTAYDRSGNSIDLQVPSQMKILQKEVLARTWHLGENTRDFVLDVVLNFFGFWPLGFFLAAALARNRRLRQYYWLAAILFCFGFSLAIEVGQIWLPARFSHLLDLVLNTTGGAVGVGVYVWVRKEFELSFARIVDSVFR